MRPQVGGPGVSAPTPPTSRTLATPRRQERRLSCPRTLGSARGPGLRVQDLLFWWPVLAPASQPTSEGDLLFPVNLLSR